MTVLQGGSFPAPFSFEDELEASAWVRSVGAASYQAAIVSRSKKSPRW